MLMFGDVLLTKTLLISALLLQVFDYATCSFIQTIITGMPACSEKGAKYCFTELFGKVISRHHCPGIMLKCRHYQYLDACFRRVGVCPADIVGEAARQAYKLHQRDIDCTDTRSIIDVHRRHRSSHQFVALLGYLQTQCTEQNCTGDVFEQCEHDIRVSNGKALADFDRHQLLRIKLDASKKLLHYPETRSEEECLLIRAILADLFVIHQRYCFHSVVTQCLCERLSLNRFCSIDCAALQHEKPTDDKLIWSNLEDRVGEYASSAISTLTSALSTALLALTSLVAVGNIL